MNIHLFHDEDNLVALEKVGMEGRREGGREWLGEEGGKEWRVGDHEGGEEREGRGGRRDRGWVKKV